MVAQEALAYYNSLTFHAEVEVNVNSSKFLFVNESDGFVEVCVQASHDPQTTFSVTLTTYDDSAIGKSVSILRQYMFL